MLDIILTPDCHHCETRMYSGNGTGYGVASVMPAASPQRQFIQFEPCHGHKCSDRTK